MLGEKEEFGGCMRGSPKGGDEMKTKPVIQVKRRRIKSGVRAGGLQAANHNQTVIRR
jgi:hypothetical protein